MRTGAEVDELTILETGNFFALGDLVDQVELEARWVAGAFGESAEASGFGHRFGFIA